MAKEKQKPYEFLSNLVLALMGTDRIFSNSFFISEFAISPNTCLLYTSDAADDLLCVDLAGTRIIKKKNMTALQ